MASKAGRRCVARDRVRSVVNKQKMRMWVERAGRFPDFVSADQGRSPRHRYAHMSGREALARHGRPDNRASWCQTNNGLGEACQANVSHGGTPQQDGLRKSARLLSSEYPHQCPSWSPQRADPAIIYLRGTTGRPNAPADHTSRLSPLPPDSLPWSFCVARLSRSAWMCLHGPLRMPYLKKYEQTHLPLLDNTRPRRAAPRRACRPHGPTRIVPPRGPACAVLEACTFPLCNDQRRSAPTRSGCGGPSSLSLSGIGNTCRQR